ncbi:NAD(P)H-dependent oxidoreductase [Lentilactobacillus otakiensis]|uniref:NAD(P)H-dependent oxidoreductase n=1 Tax=Lentilactobacillus otakiensis TaxID=481720 RepID=UPI00293C4FC0|nr:NAD(P)H-dependent oxidoreductase [Lentilactobacillus otakiensis]MDV3519366.1 NAD(P)H-dependent oxidoreductase [Lentilactobacillus otakiensis]
MKTLILISHPKFEDSGTQQFLKTSFYSLDDVKYQVIDELYADTGKIDIDKEQAALKAFDRIVFQFPMIGIHHQRVSSSSWTMYSRGTI